MCDINQNKLYNLIITSQNVMKLNESGQVAW